MRQFTPLIKLFLFLLLVEPDRQPCIYLHSEVFFIIGLETYNIHLKTTFSVNTVIHRELHISILVQAFHNMWFLWHFPGSTACRSSMTMKCYPHWKEVVELFIVGFR